MSRLLLSIFASVVMTAVVFVFARPSLRVEAGTESRPSAERSPVLVELFTSEGCSSCPPADELLRNLEQTQPVSAADVIVLSEHVDYWNRLGWTDPFSSGFFSARQNDYARAFNTDEVYTPQMVVDGKVQFVGSNRSRAQDAIAQASRSAKAGVQIAVEGITVNSASLSVTINDLEKAWLGKSADVMLAITESSLNSNVARGENAGRRLGHTAVVRRISKLGKIDDPKKEFKSEQTISISKGWNRQNLKAVVFIQSKPDLAVIGAASVPLTPAQ